MLLSSCNTTPQSAQPQARTFYESLDLDGPESAVITFVDAFQRADYPTVYWILAPDAQEQWRQYLGIFGFDRMISVDANVDPLVVWKATITNTALADLSQLEHFNDFSYYFDIVMNAAKQHGVLPIDLTHVVTVLEVKPAQTNDEYTFVDVTAKTETVEGVVTFRMIQGPSGRWRVLQVIVPGGDERDIPWSIPRADN
jgi:hypothetical protein